jgi:hypothetical protein
VKFGSDSGSIIRDIGRRKHKLAMEVNPWDRAYLCPLGRVVIGWVLSECIGAGILIAIAIDLKKDTFRLARCIEPLVSSKVSSGCALRGMGEMRSTMDMG